MGDIMLYNINMDKLKRILIKNEKAFTLVEMIIAVVVLGVLVGVSIPVWHGFISSKNLDTAVRQVASDIREVQARAMAEDIYYYGIDFDVADNQYFVHRDTTTATLFDETNRISWGKHGEVTMTLPSDTEFDHTVPADYKAIFQPSGYLPFGNNGSVYLRNDKGKIRYLTVVSTGKVSIKP